MPQDPSINGRPLQWDDLQTHQRKVVSDNLRDVGMGLPAAAERHADALSRSKKATPGKVATARAAGEMLRPEPVSLQRAANARQKLYNRGIEDRAAANPSDPHQVIPTGAGWYFEHHKEIASSAEQHGVHRDAAIAASGVMSPMNSPTNERAAVHAIMGAQTSGKVHVTPEIAAHLKRKAGRNDVSIDVDHHIGTTVSVGDLPSGTVAKLSDKAIRGHVQEHASDVDLNNIARGGIRENITKAERLLKGEVHPDDAVDPHSAPKVWSYVHNTRQAVPGSPTHVEFMGRVHQDALVRRGQISADQQPLDLYGHRDQELPRDHLLSPKSNTVEDTWQNAATFNQDKRMVPGTKTSVFKHAGSMEGTYPPGGLKTRTNPETGKRESAHPDARVGASAVLHAFNNRATQKAAEQQGVPPVAVQEVGWVQMRKDAGKDSEHNAALRAAPKESADTGQPTLPGMDHLSGAQFRGQR